MKMTADQREYICQLDKDKQVELYMLLAAASSDYQRYYVVNDFRRKNPITKERSAKLLRQRGISASDTREFFTPSDAETEASSSTATSATTQDPSTPSSEN
jgi:hypothetical protein